MCLIAAIAAAALALIWAAGATAITLAIIRSAREVDR
jgi:hypothetical protein